jgi:lysophospholipase L1-like esterase
MRWLLPVLLLAAFAAACGSDSPTQRGTYIALGDSLSEGEGASDPATTAFVPLVHEHLGDGFQLLNLGHSGDTSEQLIDHGHLDEAVAEIGQRNGDDDPDNDVKLVTLEIGGNDLLNLYFDLVGSGTCPSVQIALQKQEECVDRLAAVLEGFEPNLKETLHRLQAADAKLRILLLTLGNPFSGSPQTFDELGELGLDGTPFPEGLNEIIRAQAQETGVILVDLYPLFEGKASQLIAQEDLHPNDEGYRVMAEAVIKAIRELP